MPFQEPQLTLHQMAIFAAVAAEHSFTRAAAVVHLSESAVSQQVALLERSVGTPLVVREAGKPIRLTEAGQRLHLSCGDVFGRITIALQEIDALKRAGEGYVVLGATNNFSTYLLPSIYTSFREQNPNVTLRVERGLRHDLIEGVLTRRLDVAVVGDAADHPRLVSAFLTGTDLVVIGPPGHRLAGGAPAPFDALLAEPLVLGRWFGAREAIEGKAAELGLPLHIEWEAGRLEAQINAVAGGMGVALVPYYAIAARLRSDGLSVLRIDGFPVRQDLFVITPSEGVARPSQALLDHLLGYRASLPLLCQAGLSP